MVEPGRITHPKLPGVFTLGHCDTEVYPSDWDGPDTVRSTVVLFFGSFEAIARKDPDFDWVAEIHETVEHEVRHHLESLAGEDQLGDVDYAYDQSLNRADGRPWDPWYFQRGDPIGRGTFAVEDQVYIEQVWSQEDFDGAREVRFSWQGATYEVDRPEALADLHFIWISGGVELAPPSLELVLVRRGRWWDQARRIMGRSRPQVLETEAVARPTHR